MSTTQNNVRFFDHAGKLSHTAAGYRTVKEAEEAMRDWVNRGGSHAELTSQSTTACLCVQPTKGKGARCGTCQGLVE